MACKLSVTNPTYWLGNLALAYLFESFFLNRVKILHVVTVLTEEEYHACLDFLNKDTTTLTLLNLKLLIFVQKNLKSDGQLIISLFFWIIQLSFKT